MSNANGHGLSAELESKTLDKHAVAWWKLQFQQVLIGYRGATHNINRCVAEYEDVWKKIDSMQQRIDSLQADLRESQAEIGRLREQLLDTVDRQERMATWLRNKNKIQDKE